MKFLVRSKISPENLGLLFGLLGGIIFGATLPMTRLPVTDLDPYWLTAARAAGAGVLASAVLIGLRRPLPSLAQFRRIGIAALMLVMGFPGFSGIAMKTLPAAHAGVVVGIADGDGRGGECSGGRAAQHRILDLQFLRGSCWSPSMPCGKAAAGSNGAMGCCLAPSPVAAIGYTVSGQLARDMPGWEVISWTVVVALPASRRWFTPRRGGRLHICP
jgi:hypothetical protein